MFKTLGPTSQNALSLLNLLVLGLVIGLGLVALRQHQCRISYREPIRFAAKPERPVGLQPRKIQ